jgi:hypothetical protein
MVLKTGNVLVCDEATEFMTASAYAKLYADDSTDKLRGKELKEELNAQILDALEFGSESAQFYVNRFMRKLKRKEKVMRNDAWRSTHKSFRKNNG